MGKLSTDNIEERLKEKYNLELVDDIDRGQIPFSNLEKIQDTAYMMTTGETSEPIRPKRDHEEIRMRNVEDKMERPPWEEPQYKYQDNNSSVKTYGIREPIGHTFSRNLLILERSSPQLWSEGPNIISYTLTNERQGNCIHN